MAPFEEKKFAGLCWSLSPSAPFQPAKGQFVAAPAASGGRVIICRVRLLERQPCQSVASWCYSYTRESSDGLEPVEGNWKQVRGKIKEQWGKLTDDDLDVIDGKQE